MLFVEERKKDANNSATPVEHRAHSPGVAYYLSHMQRTFSKQDTARAAEPTLRTSPRIPIPGRRRLLFFTASKRKSRLAHTDSYDVRERADTLAYHARAGHGYTAWTWPPRAKRRHAYLCAPVTHRHPPHPMPRPVAPYKPDAQNMAQQACSAGRAGFGLPGDLARATEGCRTRVTHRRYRHATCYNSLLSLPTRGLPARGARKPRLSLLSDVPGVLDTCLWISPAGNIGAPVSLSDLVL